MPDLPSLWSQAGDAGFSPDLWLGANPPWTLAGHVFGAWSLIEPDRAPFGLPGPGVMGMHSPLVWYDTVTVVPVDGASWSGFGASLMTATGSGERLATRGARAIVDLRNGSFNFDENSLSIARGDSASWLRGEAVSGTRGLFQGFDLGGRHLWGLSGAMTRGAHHLQGAFAERGTALSLFGGDVESAGGESGALRYAVTTRALQARVSLERGYDHHQSYSFAFPELRPLSRRDAQENRGSGELSADSPLGRLGLRLEWSRARVSRTVGPAFVARADAFWGAARVERALGAGTLRLGLGAGRHDLLSGVHPAPELSYRIETRSFTGRIGVERLLTPVWSDLAPGQAPFLQRTWAGVIELSSSPAHRFTAHSSFLVGRTDQRALVQRLPLEEMWLRFGVFADRTPYDFGLFNLDAAITVSRFAAGGNGYLLARHATGDQLLVDPGMGMRAWGSVRFTAFSGELKVTLRGELETVGGRDSQGETPELYGSGEVPPHALPPYVTSGATGIAAIGDILLTVRVRNIENIPHDENWIDGSTSADALGPGRELRFALTARLRN